MSLPTVSSTTRVSLTLPATPDDTLPTNERILRFTQQESPALAALYYNYGRYLLISSTRPGSLPPNLQGLWQMEYRLPGTETIIRTSIYR